MPANLHLIAQMVFLLYALCAMVILGMNKVGNLTASISRTKYTPESTRNLQAWSRTTKLIHLAVFLTAAILAFWPD